jgi:putative spermidine/putrescine transport system permease protein
VLFYLAALVVLLITAFWQINPFTTNIERVWSLNNLTTIFTSPAYLRIIGRTVGDGGGGHRGGRRRRLPVRLLHGPGGAAQDQDDPVRGDPAAAMGELPGQGVLLAGDLHPRRVPGLVRGPASLSQVHLIYTNWAVFIVFCYLWLPFMIIPVYAALERIPPSQIEASQDLGARTWRTIRLGAAAAGPARAS